MDVSVFTTFRCMPNLLYVEILVGIQLFFDQDYKNSIVLEDDGFYLRMWDINVDKEITDYLLACRYQRSRLCLPVE